MIVSKGAQNELLANQPLPISELRDQGIELGAHLRLEHVLDLDSTRDICALIPD